VRCGNNHNYTSKQPERFCKTIESFDSFSSSFTHLQLLLRMAKRFTSGFFSSFHCTYTTTIRVTCFLSPCRLISLSSSHLKLCIRFFKKSLATLRNLVRQQGSKILFSFSLFLVLHVFLKLSGITDSTKNIVRYNLHSVVGSVLFQLFISSGVRNVTTNWKVNRSRRNCSHHVISKKIKTSQRKHLSSR
jgi:hypothetical protein